MGFAGASRLRTAIALTALLAAACSGGGSPPATLSAPEAASTPAPTAAAASSAPEAASTPAPPPLATPAPGARSGLDLVEPAPGAFEHRTFEDGEAIDWTHGTFFLDAETGRTEGYAVAGVEGGWRYHGDRDGWIEARRITGTGGWRLLVDRTTDLSWRWPGASLLLDAVSDDHLLFQDLSDGNPTGRFALANRRMEEVTRFAVDPGNAWPYARFSPDGHTIALESGNTVYLIPVRPSGPPEVLVTPAPFGVAFGSFGDDGFSVKSWPGTGEVKEQHFSWEGVALPAPEPDPGSACARGDSVPFGHARKLSPDGRYAATLEGGPYYDKEVGWVTEIPWPTIVVSDAETCAPIFRVRSAYIHLYLKTAWLSSSEGLVLSTNTGYAIALVRPFPALIPLPSGQPGPEPAPTGDGRYFAYGSRVYDAVADRWRGPSGVGRVWHRWKDSHRERWFEIRDTPPGETRFNWLLLPPKIDFPPFRDGIAFRVERTGSCLRIREEPGEAGRVLGCLPDGERLTFVEHEVLSPFLNYDAYKKTGKPWPHPSIALRGSSLWVYVRTAGGAEGWASHDWLGHD